MAYLAILSRFSVKILTYSAMLILVLQLKCDIFCNVCSLVGVCVTCCANINFRVAVKVWHVLLFFFVVVGFFFFLFFFRVAV